MNPSGPDHPITITPAAKRVRVTFAGHSFAGRVIADSRQALALHEAGHPPVLYIPRVDAIEEIPA
jgi:uncharacterized protein (DUF427 family)